MTSLSNLRGDAPVLADGKTSEQRQERHVLRSGLDWLKKSPWPVYVLGFLPAVYYFYLGATARLGADPIRTFEHVLGLWALRFLIATLLVTPVRHILGFNLLRYRRALGLMTFYYALMHFLVYMVLDKALNFNIVIEDIIKRPFITIGMAGLVFLLPLALTSNTYSIRKLGAIWNRLHKLSYLVVALGAIHFLMSVKSWPAEPVIYAGIVTLVLLFRVFKNHIPKAKPKRRLA